MRSTTCDGYRGVVVLGGGDIGAFCAEVIAGRLVNRMWERIKLLAFCGIVLIFFTVAIHRLEVSIGDFDQAELKFPIKI